MYTQVEQAALQEVKSILNLQTLPFRVCGAVSGVEPTSFLNSELNSAFQEIEFTEPWPEETERRWIPEHAGRCSADVIFAQIRSFLSFTIFTAFSQPSMKHKTVAKSSFCSWSLLSTKQQRKKCTKLKTDCVSSAQHCPRDETALGVRVRIQLLAPVVVDVGDGGNLLKQNYILMINCHSCCCIQSSENATEAKNNNFFLLHVSSSEKTVENVSEWEWRKFSPRDHTAQKITTFFFFFERWNKPEVNIFEDGDK